MISTMKKKKKEWVALAWGTKKKYHVSSVNQSVSQSVSQPVNRLG